jgi:hypothetical protein
MLSLASDGRCHVALEAGGVSRVVISPVEARKLSRTVACWVDPRMGAVDQCRDSDAVAGLGCGRVGRVIRDSG